MKRPPTYFIVAIGIVGSVLAGFGSHELVARLRREPAAAEPKWYAQRLGAAFELDVPFALQPEPLPIADNVKPLVVSMEYLTGEGDGLAIAASASQYRDGVPLDLEGAATGAIAKIRAVPGIRSVDPKTTKTAIVGKPAMDVEAVATRDRGESLRMHAVAFGAGSRLFVVMLIGGADHPATDRAWQRLRASIRAAR